MTTLPLDATRSPRPRSRPSFSIPSLVAAVCCGLIFFTEYFDLLFAAGAVLFGILGLILAMAPSVRGGVLSVISILVGVGSAIGSVFQVLF